MEVTKLTFDMQYSKVEVKPLSVETRNAFGQKADGIAATFFNSTQTAELYCDEQLEEVPFTSKVRKEVSQQKLEQLERKASHHRDLYEFIRSVKSLISFVEEKIIVTDFSNGYEEETRNTAKIDEVEALFRTFLTIQGCYDQKYRYLEEDRKPNEIKRDLKAWFEPAMRNLCLKLLKEVAQNNQDSRRGQLASLKWGTPIYNYVLDRIGALDLESNPEEWTKAAIFDLEKFFPLPNGFEMMRLSPKQHQVIEILQQSLALLKRYSH